MAAGELLRIGEVAREAGVKTSLLRYYEDVGLLPEPLRVSGQRRYDRSVLRRLTVIDVAHRAGMSLDEIRVLLHHGSAPMGDQLRELAAQRLPEIDALIDRAHRVRAWLQSAATCHCESVDDCALFDPTAIGAMPPSGTSRVTPPRGRRGHGT
jgi:DNA-binding transcriptional MerR regulator